MPDQDEKTQITQADVYAAFKRGQAHTLRLLAEAAEARVAPHEYVGLHHLMHPDDAIDCCRFGIGHPIHEVRVSPASEVRDA